MWNLNDKLRTVWYTKMVEIQEGRQTSKNIKQKLDVRNVLISAVID